MSDSTPVPVEAAPTPTVVTPPLDTLIESWLRSQTAQGLAPSTREVRRHFMAQLASHVGAVDISEFEPGGIEEWLTADSEWKDSTHNSALGACRSFFGWAKQWGHIDKDPSAPLKRRRVIQRDSGSGGLSEAEARRLIASTAAFLNSAKGIKIPLRHEVYAVSIGACLRRGEVHAITADWIDPAIDRLVIPAEIGKMRRDDTIPLPPWVARILRARAAKTPRGEPLYPIKVSHSTFYSDLERAGISLGVGRRKITPHSLRKTGVTIWAQIPGCPGMIVSWVARHRKGLTEQVYVDTTFLDGLRYAAKFPVLLDLGDGRPGSGPDKSPGGGCEDGREDTPNADILAKTGAERWRDGPIAGTLDTPRPTSHHPADHAGTRAQTAATVVADECGRPDFTPSPLDSTSPGSKSSAEGGSAETRQAFVRACREEALAWSRYRAALESAL